MSLLLDFFGVLYFGNFLKKWTNHKWCSGLTIKIFKGSMASSSLHQIWLFSLLLSKIYLNVHQKIKVDASHPPTPDPHPGKTALLNAHLALWHTVAWARWPSINFKSHSLVYSVFYMWVTRVFVLSCATLIMALILSSWAQRKSSHFPIQTNTHANLTS